MICKFMKTSFFVFVICVLMLFAAANETLACSCASAFLKTTLNQAVREAYKDSDAVFSGEVLKIDKNPNSNFAAVKFKVDKNWKGKNSSILSVRTAASSAECGYYFEIGKKYLVYAYRDNRSLHVSICSRTALLDADPDPAILNKIKRRGKLKSFPE